MGNEEQLRNQLLSKSKEELIEMYLQQKEETDWFENEFCQDLRNCLLAACNCIITHEIDGMDYYEVVERFKENFGIESVGVGAEDLRDYFLYCHAMGQKELPEELDNLKVLGSIWFGLLGVVKAQDKITGELKIYIGMGDGENENEDIEQILAWGKKYTPEHFKFLLKWAGVNEVK